MERIKRMSRERIALLLSLAVNFLVLGVLVGGAVTHRGRPDAAPTELSMGPFTDAFSEEDRRALKERAKAERGAMREMIRQTDADLLRVVAALRQEPWDEAVLRGAVERLRARFAARAELGETLLFERLQAMSPEARRGFAERLERRVKEGPRRGHD